MISRTCGGLAVQGRNSRKAVKTTAQGSAAMDSSNFSANYF